MRRNNPMGVYIETDQGDTVNWDGVDKETFAKAYREFRRILGVPDSINNRTPLAFQKGERVVVFHPEHFGEHGRVTYTSAVAVDVQLDNGIRTAFERKDLALVK